VSCDEAAIWTTARLPLTLATWPFRPTKGAKLTSQQTDCYILHPFSLFSSTNLDIPSQFIQSSLLLAAVPLMTAQVKHSK